MNTRCLIFQRLGYLGLIPAFFFAIFGYQVRYLRLVGGLNSDDTAKSLCRMNIKPLTYEDISGAPGKYFALLSKFQKIAYLKLFHNSVEENVFIRHFNVEVQNREKLRLALEQSIQSEVAELCEIILFCENSPEIRDSYRAQVIGSFGCYTSFMEELSPALEHISFHSIPDVNFIASIFCAAWKQLIAGVRRQNVWVQQGGNQTLSEELPSSTVENFPQNVLYFPHKGIFYGSLYRKDHYYSQNRESIFFPTNILHLSLGDSPSEIKKSLAFYKASNIPYADVYTLSGRHLPNLAREYMMLLWSNRRLIYKKSKFPIFSMLFFFKPFCKLSIFLVTIDKTPRARIALIGYDALFPPLLAVALSMRNIVTVAVQERFLQPFQGIYRYIFDHYLAIGEKVCKFIADNPEMFHIGKCYPIGPIRAELIDARAAHEAPEKYDRIKKAGYFLILALEWHSVSTAVENARALGNNWQANRRFYLDMIKLAREFPDSYVVIKGKYGDSLTNPYLKDLVSTIAELPNISIEGDIEIYSPETMAACADFTIACSTSLADDILSIGRPALIYDINSIPSGWFGYEDFPVVVKTYADLAHRLQRYRGEKEFIPGGKFAACRRDYYSMGDAQASPRKRLNRYLENLWDELYKKEKA